MANKRKRILLLSDDLRMTSGIARMSREFVLGTLDHYDWIQIAGAIKHPEEGKRVVIQSDEHFKLPRENCCVLYPTNGYGNPEQLRTIINIEKPDAILHFTDPRFWGWLYQMEHEIRSEIPIMYYNIWDDIPDPLYNKNFYRSCDLLMAISKQTYGINKRILSKYDYKDWQIKYVPHGISDTWFSKINKPTPKYEMFQQKYNLDKYDFKILYLNRNIRRKNPGDTALAYKHFMDNLPKEKREKCCMVWHTQPSDENGTDIKAVCRDLLPDYPVIFPDAKFSDEEMNYIYNACDVYINLASNEGFGLGSCEAMMTATPIVVNVTGGLQDQCGFKNEKGEYLTAEDYVELASNHHGKYQEHGEWVKPVFPSSISLQGSPMTPYIFDDRARWDEAGDAIRYWYDMGKEKREKCGELGRQFVLGKDSGMTGKEMSRLMHEAIEGTFENWKPKQKYTLEVV